MNSKEEILNLLIKLRDKYKNTIDFKTVSYEPDSRLGGMGGYIIPLSSELDQVIDNLNSVITKIREM